MDNKLYKEIRTSFTGYLTEKKLRKTEERNKILEQVCTFTGHFDIDMLHQKMKETNFHVSKSTLYNTMEVLLDAGLIIAHPINTKSVQYELKVLAENHLHLICTKCYSVRELKNTTIKPEITNLKTNRFSPEFFSLYIYGLCMKCKPSKRKKMK